VLLVGGCVWRGLLVWRAFSMEMDVDFGWMGLRLGVWDVCKEGILC
jgi:hypothetical protein